MSYWHHQSFGLSEPLLISVKGKELSGSHKKRRRYVQYIETTVPTSESVRSREPFSFIDHISKIADLNLYPAAGPISLKLSPEQCRLSWGDPFPKLCETQGITQLIFSQCREGQSLALRLHPSDCTRSVGIIPVEGE